MDDEGIEELKKFYNVLTDRDLIGIMAVHIENLQKKLNGKPVYVFPPRKAREG